MHFGNVGEEFLQNPLENFATGGLLGTFKAGMKTGEEGTALTRLGDDLDIGGEEDPFEALNDDEQLGIDEVRTDRVRSGRGKKSGSTVLTQRNTQPSLLG